MIIKDTKTVPYEDISEYKGVKKQILIGSKDGSEEIAMRYFSLEIGGATPYHFHGFPHLVKVESGNGVVIDKEGKEHKLEKGSIVFINDDEVHGFKNTGQESFDFICIVPDRGEK